MMIIDKNFNFGVIWEITGKYGPLHCGTVLILINSRVCPLYTGYDHTLMAVFGGMRSSLEEPWWNNGSDGMGLGNRKVSRRQIDYGSVPNIFTIGLGDLDTVLEGDPYTYLHMAMGYDGDEERLFYTVDGFKTVDEVRFPRGTVEKVIMSLPTKPEYFERQLEQSPVLVV